MDPRAVGYEDYVGMCGCPPVMGIDAMLAHYRITMADWAQIAGYWNGIIATDPQYMQHGMRVEQEAARIRSGGAPRPIAFAGAQPGSVAPPVEAPMHAVSGAMPGAVPPPGYGAPPAVSGAMPGSVPPPGYGAPPPGYGASPPGYGASPYGAQQPGYPPPGPPGPPPGPSYGQQASAFGSEVGNAFSALGSAFGSVVNSVVGTFSYGQAVMVQWSDGQRYPATVLTQQSGQVQVTFPDGRQVWVPQHFVVMR